MSATFKISKKKHNQNDLRRLMQEQRERAKPTEAEPKIDSPLAKYNSAGQLTCILCKSVVRSGSVWKVHINSKSHKENLAAAKHLKELQTTSGTVVKRYSNEIEAIIPEKKLKCEIPDTSAVLPKLKNGSSEVPIPKDFFDTHSSKSYFEITLRKTSIKKELVNITREKNNENNAAANSVDIDESKEILPEGFFDDPVKDAKIRNIDYKDPQEEEWERFQREIKEESSLSNAIIAEEREEATTERQIEEIDEQIQKWSKVLDLEKKKEVISNLVKHRPTKMDHDGSESESSVDDNEDFDEFLDWRAKRLSR